MDMFSTRTMLGIVQNNEKKAKTFLRDRYFSNRVTYSTEKIDIDLVGPGKRKLAPFVNPKIGGVIVERDGYKTNSYEAPEVSPMRVTTAEDCLKRSPGESVYSSKSPADRAAEILGKDLRDLVDMIDRREETMSAEALFTGKVTINGEGYSEVINYWPSETADQPKTTLATAWTDTTADPFADLRATRRLVIQQSGIAPTDLICSNESVEAFLSRIKANGKELDMRRVDMGAIDPQHLPGGVTYWGYLKDSALDVYSYDEWYLDEEGNEVPMVPAHSALLASPNAHTTLAYGVVALYKNGENSAPHFYEGARVPDSWVQRANPAGRILQVKSRPLPIVNQVNAFHVLVTGA